LLDPIPTAPIFNSFNQNAILILDANKNNDGKLHPHIDQFNIIHYSVIPWVKFTSFKHARKFDKNDSIPKIVLGKYQMENGKMNMPVSVEVHHSLMDGLHVGKYFDLFQKYLDEPNLYLEKNVERSENAEKFHSPSPVN